MDEKEVRAYANGYKDALGLKDGYKYSLFGMELGKALDVLSEHIIKENKSEVPNIPIGYEFNWHEREKVNSFFADIKRQGFKVIK